MISEAEVTETQDSQIPDWFSKGYYTGAKKGSTFGLKTEDKPKLWGLVKQLQDQVSDVKFDSVLTLQKFIWEQMGKLTCKVEGIDERMTLEQLLNKFRASKNRGPIKVQRFCDGLFGSQTLLMVGKVSCVLEEQGQLQIHPSTLTLANNLSQPLNQFELQMQGGEQNYSVQEFGRQNPAFGGLMEAKKLKNITMTEYGYDAEIVTRRGLFGIRREGTILLQFGAIGGNKESIKIVRSFKKEKFFEKVFGKTPSTKVAELEALLKKIFLKPIKVEIQPPYKYSFGLDSATADELVALVEDLDKMF